jgi:hypothetical protein
MVLVISSTNSITLRIAAALLIVSLVVVLIIAKNVRNLQFLYSDSQNLDFICNGNLQQKVILNCLCQNMSKLVMAGIPQVAPLHVVDGFWTTLCWTLSSQTYFPTWVHGSCQNLSDFPFLVWMMLVYS